MSKNNNKSLYIYTALIFLVAVILILISFFGQSKLAQTQPDPISVEEAHSITEKAAALSEENKRLLNDTADLKNKLSEKENQLLESQAKLALYKKSQENTQLLLSANGYCSKKMYSEAKQIIENIDDTILTEDEKIIFTQVKKAIEKHDN